jgi:4a-hydroxytetrahydrobiopterin dehydratase
MSKLTEKHCVPCEGGTPPLTVEEIRPYLGQVSSEWRVTDGKKIEREFSFGDFKEAMAFVNNVADLAEKEGHHPDFHIHYSRVTIELWTHAIDGLSENDFIMAAKIDALF